MAERRVRKCEDAVTPIPNQVETADTLPLRVLVPGGAIESLDDFLRTARALTKEPFAAEQVAFLSAVSQGLLKHPRLRRDPAGAALGFWLRRANLVAFETDFRTRIIAGRRVVSTGLVFHVAPANVDTMFAYSWALSFLAGNANVVRLTTRMSPLVEDLLQCLNTVFVAHAESCRGNWFITYGHDDAITGRLSAMCDARIVWGGDETVRRLRAVPLNPHAAERSFASKRSLSVISANAFLSAEEASRRQVAEGMAVDIVPFGQMACSSPHVVYWVGAGKDCRRAMQVFEAHLETAMEAKLGDADFGWAVRRLNFAFGAVAEGRADELSHHPHTTAVFSPRANSAELAEPCGAGLLAHTAVDSVSSVPLLLGRHHQTIMYFGLTNAERDDLARDAGRAGVDRVVPVGQALDFGPYWDGYDFWGDLTRVVVVK